MNSKVCQFTELCEKKHKSEVKKWNKTSHFYEEMLTYCFGLHWHSVQLKLLKQHENMAFLFLICRAGTGSYLFIIISITSIKILSQFWKQKHLGVVYKLCLQDKARTYLQLVIAMGCRQCLPHSAVQRKGKNC